MDHAQDFSRSGEVKNDQASADVCVQRYAHFNHLASDCALFVPNSRRQSGRNKGGECRSALARRSQLQPASAGADGSWPDGVLAQRSVTDRFRSTTARDGDPV